MSYRLDLDEYTEEALRAELKLREDRRAKGVCDYCNRPPETNSCKFPERHQVQFKLTHPANPSRRTRPR